MSILNDKINFPFFVYQSQHEDNYQHIFFVFAIFYFIFAILILMHATSHSKSLDFCRAFKSLKCTYIFLSAAFPITSQLVINQSALSWCHFAEALEWLDALLLTYLKCYSSVKSSFSNRTYLQECFTSQATIVEICLKYYLPVYWSFL